MANEAGQDRLDPMLSDKIRSIVTLGIAGGFLVLLFRNPWIPSAIRLLFAIALLLGLVRSSAAILLVLVQIDLALIENDLPFQISLVLNVATTLMTVLLLMAACRLRSAQELTGSLSYRRAFGSLWGGSRSLAERRAAEPVGAEGISVMTWLWSMLLMSVSGLMLVVFPEQSLSVMEYGLTPVGMRCLQIGIVLVIWYAVLTIPLSELWWRRLSPDQAGMYLRSLFLGWSHRDFRMVVRRQVRRSRRIRRQKRSVSAASRTPYRSFRYSPGKWGRKRSAEVATQTGQSLNVSSKEND